MEISRPSKNQVNVSANRYRSFTAAHLALMVAIFALAFFCRPTASQAIEIDITRGSTQAIPIAIPVFLTQDPASAQIAREISNTIAADLALSGLFDPLDRAAFIERLDTVNRTPRFADWRIIKAQALVVGEVIRGADGSARTLFRLWDVFSGKQLAGQQYSTTETNARRVAHIIADQVYERLTGETGYFDTRVVYIDETGPKNARVKRLAVMDQDGYNRRVLTDGKDLILTPRFSPNTQEITYMSYQGGTPRVHKLNIETGARGIVGDFPGMSFAPRFSPDGNSIIMSLQHGSYANIHTMNLATREKRRLTNTTAIDTAPCYSPDGKQIVFESDRDGGQQLYVMRSNGTAQRRISFGDGRYSTPVWSPRGDLIAFTKQYAGRFLIGVMRPDGSGERILTEGYHNEGPTWAPNGRVIMFFRDTPGPKGGPRIYSVDLTGYNERVVRTPSFASDPAWSPPLGRK